MGRTLFDQVKAHLSTVVRTRVFIASLLVLLVLFQVYPTLGSFFMSDDFAWLDFTKEHETITSVALAPSPGGWTTPIPNLVFWTELRIFGFDARGYYITNILLHLLNGLLVFQIANVVTQDHKIAAGTSAIFLLHFASFSDWGALVWISVFVQPIVSVMYFGCVFFYIRFLQMHGKWNYVMAIVFFALALLSKETALSLPILLLLLVWYFSPIERLSIKNLLRGVRVIAPFVAIFGAYLLYEVSFQFWGQYLSKGSYGIGWNLLTSWRYFSNLVLPNPTSPPVQNFLLRSFPSWVLSFSNMFLLGVQFTMLVLAVLLVWQGGRQVRFWIAWMVITYLPFMGFVEGFAGPNRYFYLPLVGFAALFAEGLGHLGDHLRGRKQFVFSTLALATIAVLLWGFNLIPSRLWQQQMSENSEVRRAVLSSVGNQMRTLETQPSIVYLEGFPDKFGDLSMAIPLFFGIKTIFIDAGRVERQPNSLSVEFQSGAVTVQYPK